jgi:hypothetical protein
MYFNFCFLFQSRDGDVSTSTTASRSLARCCPSKQTSTDLLIYCFLEISLYSFFYIFRYYDIVRDVRQNKGSILKASVDYIRKLKLDQQRKKLYEEKMRQQEATNRKLLLKLQVVHFGTSLMRLKVNKTNGFVSGIRGPNEGLRNPCSIVHVEASEHDDSFWRNES